MTDASLTHHAQWQRPVFLLVLAAIAMPLSFATWSALLNNFVVDAAQFDGADIGLLHTVRETPGLLAVTALFWLAFIREQKLMILSLILLGAATALTARFPSLGGILTLTLLSSFGFHYFETMNQSLQLQWLSKEEAPKVLGLLIAVGSGATIVAYGLIALLWNRLSLSYDAV